MPNARRSGVAAWLVAVAALSMLPAGSADDRTRTRALSVPSPVAVVNAAMTSSPGSAVLGVPDVIARPAGLSAARCEWPDRGALDAIVPVAADNGSHASGVVLSAGRVLTAAHAVQGAGRFFVRIGTDFRLARLLVVDHAADLAILSVDTAGIAPLPLAATDPGASQAVWAAGFPRAQSLATSSGVFQKNSDGALHTSATIDSGQSGGGLLACSQGHYSLVGMLRGYGAYLSGDQYVKLENHSVSVAATTIQGFLATYR